MKDLNTFRCRLKISSNLPIIVFYFLQESLEITRLKTTKFHFVCRIWSHRVASAYKLKLSLLFESIWALLSRGLHFPFGFRKITTCKWTWHIECWALTKFWPIYKHWTLANLLVQIKDKIWYRLKSPQLQLRKPAIVWSWTGNMFPGSHLSSHSLWRSSISVSPSNLPGCHVISEAPLIWAMGQS